MSIQTELTRIKNAKAAIKAAIEGKGVTVPDATLLDGMAALIESIEAGGGGGLPEPFTVIKTGTFIMSSLVYCNNYTINHSLGVAPVIFAIYNDVNVNSSGSISFIFYINHRDTNNKDCGGYCNSKGSDRAIVRFNSFIVDENTFKFNDSTSYYGSNRQFRWVALG